MIKGLRERGQWAFDFYQFMVFFFIYTFEIGSQNSKTENMQIAVPCATIEITSLMGRTGFWKQTDLQSGNETPVHIYIRLNPALTQADFEKA